MLKRREALDICPDYDFSRLAPLSRIVFFDIETTGLSAGRAGLYLIGAVAFEDGEWRLYQWFAESLYDEEAMLHAFFGYLAEKKRAIRLSGEKSGSLVLVHFNGDGFDIPFLRTLLRRWRLPYDFTGILSLDLFKKIKNYKALLGLKSCRLKSVEQFFGIAREDKFGGGELIYVYEEYLRLHNLSEESCEYNEQNLRLKDALLKTLLLHNAEDMANLPMICGLLSYDELFSGQFSFCSAAVETVSGQKVLDARFLLSQPLPKELTLSCGPYVLSAEGEELQVTAALYEGELKYFFPDPKNYYYLPAEDCAVHRSVGEFVERKARKPATAKTCYQRREGLFLPEPADIFLPVFLSEYKGKMQYAQYAEELLSDGERLKAYALALLSQFLKASRSRKASG